MADTSNPTTPPAAPAPEVSETSSLQSCEAHIETAAETATIYYNITLEGSNFQVLITKVDAKTR